MVTSKKAIIRVNKAGGRMYYNEVPGGLVNERTNATVFENGSAALTRALLLSFANFTIEPETEEIADGESEG